MFGLIAAVSVAWLPISRGFEAYQPIADHGECGFLCVFLIASVFWWVVGAVFAAAAWIGVALLARLIAPSSAK
jgi:hypothetical protein